MKIVCPNCKQRYEIEKENYGMLFYCNICNKEFIAKNSSLIECPDCFELISKHANTCIHCGAPVRNLFSQDLDYNIEDRTKNDIIFSPKANTNNITRPRISQTFKNEKEEILAILNPSGSYYIADFILGILLIPLIIGFFIIIFAYIKMKKTTYTISTTKVTVKEGLFNIKETTLWIKDIRSIHVSQSFQERFFGIGSIAMGTASTAEMEMEIRAIPDAPKIAKLIEDLRKQ